MLNQDYADKCREEYIQKMISQGYKIVYPAPNELQIDIDTEDQYKQFNRQLDSLIHEYHEIRCTIKPSRNGLPGRHATIIMPFEMTDAERIAWQATLGSDPFRELMSLFRLERGDSHPTLFVENNFKKGVF